MTSDVKDVRPFEGEAFTLVKVQSKTESISSDSLREEETEGGGSRILSDFCKVASRGLRSKVGVESEEDKFR